VPSARPTHPSVTRPSCYSTGYMIEMLSMCVQWSIRPLTVIYTHPSTQFLIIQLTSQSSYTFNCYPAWRRLISTASVSLFPPPPYVCVCVSHAVHSVHQCIQVYIILYTCNTSLSSIPTLYNMHR
jgi:hypothetical protein